MNLTKLYVRSSCGRIYSPWIILTTTRARQLLMMLFMEQEYHSFKTGLRSLTESCVPNQNYNQAFQGRRYRPTLPESYTNLIHVPLLKKDVITSPVECTLMVNLLNLLWQTAAHRLVNEEVQSVDDPIGWAAFHANAQQPRDFDVTITPLLPFVQMIPNMWP